MNDDMTTTTGSTSSCCPTTAQLAGAYIHDDGQLPGQFRRTLTLVDNGTFSYDRKVDVSSFYSE
ncbi:MAG: hypothetical protein ACR2HQ_05750 [Ilumatobacteraceae bacterium]